ncbi:hypothetical protein [Phormidesmis sp. 146-33]
MKKILFTLLFVAFFVVAFLGSSYAQINTSNPNTRLRNDRLIEIVRRHEVKPGQSLSLTAEGREKRRDSDGCGKHACLCEGGKQCLSLVDSGKCNSGTFHCAGPPPTCVCEKN